MTTWNQRTPSSTTWEKTWFWGAYLKTVGWDYVTDVLGRRIVVIVRWGSLPLTNWTPRTIPS